MKHFKRSHYKEMETQNESTSQKTEKKWLAELITKLDTIRKLEKPLFKC